MKSRICLSLQRPKSMPNSLPPFEPVESSREMQQALDSFVELLEKDRNILAAVRVGSFDEELMWWKESIGLWIIEVDGVTRRLKSDGNEERIYRTLVQDGINIHAEIIPRTRFKQMVEGSSRTAFSCNFFALRELVYCDDPSIAKWFDAANKVATKDQDNERMIAMTWAMRAARFTRKRLERKDDLDLAFEAYLWAVHSIACVEVISDGKVYEHTALYKAMELNPDLFQEIYTDLISRKRTKKKLIAALDRIDEYVQDHAERYLRPLLKFLKKEKRTVPLSQICDHFAHSQIYPGHLESACEWLEREGIIEKLSMPFRITKKSRTEVEEPAYFYDP